MKYGYNVNTGEPITLREYVEKIRSINDAINGKKPKCPSLFDKKENPLCK